MHMNWETHTETLNSIVQQEGRSAFTLMDTLKVDRYIKLAQDTNDGHYPYTLLHKKNTALF